MAMDIRDRARIRALVSSHRAVIKRRWPLMPAAEIDRRARLKTALRATADDLSVSTRKAREHIAGVIGTAPNSLKMVLQGHRRLGSHKAVALVSMFPELLCLADVITADVIPEMIQLHRQDLPAWEEKKRAA